MRAARPGARDQHPQHTGAAVLLICHSHVIPRHAKVPCHQPPFVHAAMARSPGAAARTRCGMPVPTKLCMALSAHPPSLRDQAAGRSSVAFICFSTKSRKSVSERPCQHPAVGSVVGAITTAGPPPGQELLGAGAVRNPTFHTLKFQVTNTLPPPRGQGGHAPSTGLAGQRAHHIGSGCGGFGTAGVRLASGVCCVRPYVGLRRALHVSLMESKRN